MPDNLNQLGKKLAKNSKDAKTALNRISADMGMPEFARDVFDVLVPFEMGFNVPKDKTKVNLKLTFMGTPDIITNCCASDYCIVCQVFLYTELANNVAFDGHTYDSVLYLDYPYQPGSVYIIDPNVVARIDPITGQLIGLYDPSNSTLLGTTRVIELSPADGMVAIGYPLPTGAGSESLAFIVYYVISYGEGGV